METHLDADGNRLDQGYRVAWPSRQSSNSWLTFGTVQYFEGRQVALRTDLGRTVKKYLSEIVRVHAAG